MQIYNITGIIVQSYIIKCDEAIGFIDYFLKFWLLMKSKSERDNKKDFKSALSSGDKETPPWFTFFIKGSMVEEGWSPSE